MKILFKSESGELRIIGANQIRLSLRTPDKTGMAPVRTRKMRTKPPVKGACPGFETCTRVAQRMPGKSECRARLSWS